MIDRLIDWVSYDKLQGHGGFFSKTQQGGKMLQTQWRTSLAKVIWEEGRVAAVSQTEPACGQHA